MAELVIYMVILMLTCLIILWIIEQYFPKTAEKIENILNKFDNE